VDSATAMSVANVGHQAPTTLMPLIRQLCDLKRVRSAAREGSIAERAFSSAWAALANGADPLSVMSTSLLDALIATRLGDLDAQLLAEVGIPPAELAAIRYRAWLEASKPLEANQRAAILDAAKLAPSIGRPPPFVARLSAQPRAGATSPSRGRLVLEPPESHADHCMLVALIGALIAPAWGGNGETVFVAGLAHHLHNALLPDAGFVGEMILGKWLKPAIDCATVSALDELAPLPRALVISARNILLDAETPEGCAFHAADTLDRVLQVEHHLRAAGTTMKFVLQDMELVHPGPTRHFQEAVLQRMGLAA
jgi:hypothetical protein